MPDLFEYCGCIVCVTLTECYRRTTRHIGLLSMPWRFCVWDRLKSYSARKYKTHMNAVSILRAWQEEGSILRNVIGGDQSVNGRQSLNKLLCWQLHGQEAAKLNQRVLTLKKAKSRTLFTPVCPNTENTTQYSVSWCSKIQHNHLCTSVSWHWKYNTILLYTSMSWH